jgi:hypothetical protein
MTDDQKTYAALAREYSSLVFVRDGRAIFSASSCDAPVYRPIVGDRAQTTALLYGSIANFYQRTMTAIATSESTCRNRKDAIAATADHYGRSIRTVETAISTVLSSSATT